MILHQTYLTASARGAKTAAAERTLVVRGGSMFDSKSGCMKPVEAICVAGDRITAVAAPGNKWTMPPDATIIDATGKFILPGLIDAHVHLIHILRDLRITADEIFPLFLANGVTTLRNVGDEVVAQRLLSKYAEEHPECAPRVFMGSFLIDGNPAYHSFVSWPLVDVNKVPRFVEEMCDWGVQTFKLYVGVSGEVGQAVIKEAHRHGKWVTAHLAWGYRMQDAVDDGIDSLEHTDTIFDYMLPPDAPTWPSPQDRKHILPADLAARQRQILQMKAEFNFDQPQVSQLINALVRQKVAVVPTLVVYRNWMLLRDQPDVMFHSDLRQMPSALREGWLSAVRANPLNPETLDLRRSQLAKLQELTGRLYEAGVELMVGTDTPVQLCPPGAAIHQEMELLVASGIPPGAVLTAATRNAARALNQSDRIGEIAPGKLADLLILNSNPLIAIRNTRDIFKILRGGWICDPQSLLAKINSSQ